jgi:hypothetical protein
MAEKAHTAETIFDLIYALEQEERERLFELLAEHPESKGATDWKMTVLCMRLDRLTSRREEMYFQRDLERERAVEATEPYLRGPDERAYRKEQRMKLVRQYVDAGMKDPKRILEALRNDAPKLAKVGVKTIKNMLSELKKRPRRSS